MCEGGQYGTHSLVAVIVGGDWPVRKECLGEGSRIFAVVAVAKGEVNECLEKSGDGHSRWGGQRGPDGIIIPHSSGLLAR